MRVSLVGNCQIGSVSPILSAVADIRITSVPAVHQITERHRDMMEKEFAAADWICVQPVNDQYPVEFVRTSHIQALYPEKLITWPNCYFVGYAPEWNVLREPAFGHYTGPLLGYHSSKILLGYFKGMSIAETAEFIESATVFDRTNYATIIPREITNLRTRENGLSIAISDFILAEYRKSRLFHIMNHPNLDVMIEVAERLLAAMGAKVARPPAALFNDIDLISAWHPENPFVRQHEQLEFPAITAYRGTHLIPDTANPTGFRTEGTRIYQALDLVSAFYTFYDANREHLQTHARVTQVLAGLPDDWAARL